MTAPFYRRNRYSILLLLLDHFLYFDRTVAVCRADEVQARSKFALYGTADRVDDGRYDGLLYFGCVNRRAATL